MSRFMIVVLVGDLEDTGLSQLLFQTLESTQNMSLFFIECFIKILHVDALEWVPISSLETLEILNFSLCFPLTLIAFWQYLIRAMGIACVLTILNDQPISCFFFISYRGLTVMVNLLHLILPSRY